MKENRLDIARFSFFDLDDDIYLIRPFYGVESVRELRLKVSFLNLKFFELVKRFIEVLPIEDCIWLNIQLFLEF